MKKQFALLIAAAGLLLSTEVIGQAAKPVAPPATDTTKKAPPKPGVAEKVKTSICSYIHYLAISHIHQRNRLLVGRRCPFGASLPTPRLNLHCSRNDTKTIALMLYEISCFSF